MSDRRRSLLRHGMLLFILGLVTGLIEEKLRNPRMGLEAHLEGLMNGTFMLAVGAVWDEARLSRRLSNVTFATLLYGTYANWATTTAAAILGTAAMTPLTSGTLRAGAWQEAAVGTGFVSVALAMLIASFLLLWSFRGAAMPLDRSNDSGAA